MSNSVRPQRNAIDDCLSRQGKKAEAQAQFIDWVPAKRVRLINGLKYLKLVGVSQPSSTGPVNSITNRQVAVLIETNKAVRTKIPPKVRLFAVDGPSPSGRKIQLLTPVTLMNAGRQLDFDLLGRPKSYPLVV
ncbi:MAG TPA: hypothetical protein VJI33_04890 [Candidatus Paceibacterota bacterium]